MKKLVSLFVALVLVLCIAAPSLAADLNNADYQANQLKVMGLFQGVSDSDFDLDRAPTRTESLVMLIRLLGKEDEALAGSYNHPFTDVPAWADKYVGYAYANSLTNGISATKFGAKDTADSNIYSTFVLRALGYDDSAGDFSWQDANDLATQLGIVTQDVDTETFLRADAVLISYAALNAPLKNATQTLGEKLAVPDLSTYIGTYEMTKETENGKEVADAEEMLYLHADGSMVIYDKGAEEEWINGTWTIKNGTLYTTTALYGTDKGTLNGDTLVQTNGSWSATMQKVEASSALADYVGTYVITAYIHGSIEKEESKDMLYLHEDGTMSYTITSASGCKWIYGTWSADDGVISLDDDSYGPSTGTLDGNDFTWRYDWTGYYDKVAADATFADYAGIYNMTSDFDKGAKLKGSQGVLYLQEDGTWTSYYKDAEGEDWIIGTWSVKDGIISTNDSSYGDGQITIDNNGLCIWSVKNWQGYYQKTAADASLAAYAGTYEVTKEEASGVVSDDDDYMIYLHGDGTMAWPYDDSSEESGYSWEYGYTWSVKNDVITFSHDTYGSSGGTIDSGAIVWNDSWLYKYQKLDAAVKNAEYVGKYKLTNLVSENMEKEGNGDMLYLLSNGTMAYTVTSDTACKWIYGTWSVDDDDVVSLIDDVYGLGLGTLDGDTFIWRDDWSGYYEKILEDAGLADEAGTYELIKEELNGMEVTGSVGMLYLQEDGTQTSYYKSATGEGKWSNGIWSGNDASFSTTNEEHPNGQTTIDDNGVYICNLGNWTGYYQKTTEVDASLAKYVGAYKITKEVVNGAEYTDSSGMLYLHSDGTMAYTVLDSSEESGYKWIYGTWSVKNGVITFVDDVYGTDEGEIDGGTIIWVDNWTYYYDKLD